MSSTGSGSDMFSGIAAAATGMGILTFALFPFAVPLLLLTVVAGLVLALPLLALAAIAAILAGARLGVRAAARGIHGLRGARSASTGPLRLDGRLEPK